MIAGKEEVLGRWGEYFDRLLNPRVVRAKEQTAESRTREREDSPINSPNNGRNNKSGLETKKYCKYYHVIYYMKND